MVLAIHWTGSKWCTTDNNFSRHHCEVKKRQDFRTEIVYIEGGEKSIANIKSLVSTLDLHKHTTRSQKNILENSSDAIRTVSCNTTCDIATTSQFVRALKIIFTLVNISLSACWIESTSPDWPHITAHICLVWDLTLSAASSSKVTSIFTTMVVMSARSLWNKVSPKYSVSSLSTLSSHKIT